jgi:hypothetical protein
MRKLVAWYLEKQWSILFPHRGMQYNLGQELKHMKRLVLLVVFVMFFGLLGSFAESSHQASLQRVSARRHHHRATRHHAHKAGRRHRARHAHAA